MNRCKLVADAVLPSATGQTDLPRIDVGQVHVRHVDVRHDVGHHIKVRDAIVDVDVDDINRCVMDARMAELGIRWTLDDGTNGVATYFAPSGNHIGQIQ